MPSLTQLEEAVDAFVTEHRFDNIIVVVDATFGHRITPKERRWFDELVATNKIITPPAGAIGRGDAFILQIATRANATVLSNDSFQEFHGTHTWLFEEGRLYGGKPVPYIGWVFVSRAPVRGPTSRRAVKKATSPRATAATDTARAPRLSASMPMPVPTSPPPGPPRSITPSTSVDEIYDDVTTADAHDIAHDRAPDTTATLDDTTTDDTDLESLSTDADGTRRPKRRSRRGRKPAVEAPRTTEGDADHKFNETLAFQGFRDAHPLGTAVEVVVDRFSSHGAYAKVDDVEVYIPTKALGDPPPPRARDVLTIGEPTLVVIDRYDDITCGIDVRAIRNDERDAYYASARASSSDLSSERNAEIGSAIGTTSGEGSEQPTRRSEPVATKKAAAKKATAKKAPAKKAAATKAPAKKAVAKKAVAKKAPAKKAPAKKAVAAKAPAKKAAAKKAPAKKAVAAKAPAKKAAAKKAVAKKAPAKKAPAKKASAKK